MITTDFSGSYDYEKEEAEHAVETLKADYAGGYYRNNAEYKAAIEKELAHWEKVFSNEPESIADFKRHFNAAIAECAN